MRISTPFKAASMTGSSRKALISLRVLRSTTTPFNYEVMNSGMTASCHSDLSVSTRDMSVLLNAAAMRVL